MSTAVRSGPAGPLRVGAFRQSRQAGSSARSAPVGITRVPSRWTGAPPVGAPTSKASRCPHRSSSTIRRSARVACIPVESSTPGRSPAGARAPSASRTRRAASSASSLSAGAAHNCAISTRSSVICWGANGSGQSMPPTGAFDTVSAGAGHSCGVRVNGPAKCWGLNSSRAGERAARHVPRDLSGVPSHVCNQDE